MTLESVGLDGLAREEYEETLTLKKHGYNI